MRHWASPPTLWAFLSSSEREAIRLTSPSKSVSRSVVSNSLHPCELYPTRLLCPRNSPGKNTGVGCHFLLQGIFLTQASNLCLLHLLQCQADSLLLGHLGSPLQIKKYDRSQFFLLLVLATQLALDDGNFFKSQSSGKCEKEYTANQINSICKYTIQTKCN